MKKDITELYCLVDDFCKFYAEYEKNRLLPRNKQGNRKGKMHISEMLTIILMYHTSGSKNFKYFYKLHIEYLHKQDFPNAVSYNRFIELIPRLFMTLNILMHLLKKTETGI